MHLLTRLAVRLEQARRHRVASSELRGLSRHELDRSCLGRGSLPELARAALKPGEATWLVARAVSLRAF